MATLRLFGPAREAAGLSSIEVDRTSVAEVLSWAAEQFGAGFALVLERSAVWVNGESAPPSRAVEPGDEVAILPPVSGG